MNKLLIPAFHEAGHAVVACVLNLPLKGCLLKSHFGGLTVLQVSLSALTAEQNVMWTLAGPIAERRSGLSLTESPLAFQEQTHDEQARDVLAAHHGVWPDSHIVTVELGQDRYRTERIVDRRWAWIKRVAERLTEDMQLSGEQVQRLFVVSIR